MNNSSYLRFAVYKGTFKKAIVKQGDPEFSQILE